MQTPTNGMQPIHPGEILREEFVAPMGIDAKELATRLGVPVSDVEAILGERQGITPDLAARLAEHLGGDAQTWLNLQAAYAKRQPHST